MEDKIRSSSITFVSTSSSWTEDHAMKALLQGIFPSFGSVVQTNLTDFSAFRGDEEELRRKRYATAANLLSSWLEDKSDYDEKVGAELEKVYKNGIKLRAPK